MINVTKTYMPSRKTFDKYIDGIYERNWLTNKGPLVQELNERLKEYLDLDNLVLVTNGTLALQLAYRVLRVAGETESQEQNVLTTPFTFVATSSSLKWDNAQPIYSDICERSWCLSSEKAESMLSHGPVRAIVPVHVFGNVCDLEGFERLGDDNNIPIIYDASHAFGVQRSQGNIFRYGDASTLSFHATKIFHSIEGGGVIFRKKEHAEIAQSIINFGIRGPENIERLGINMKMNEFQAAMGLCVLDEMGFILESRSEIWNRYRNTLKDEVAFQQFENGIECNNAYAPILLKDEEQCLRIQEGLISGGVLPRRYFYPSLDTLGIFSELNVCATSRDIASRILCLPIFPGLTIQNQDKIVKIVKRNL